MVKSNIENNIGNNTQVTAIYIPKIETVTESLENLLITQIYP